MNVKTSEKLTFEQPTKAAESMDDKSRHLVLGMLQAVAGFASPHSVQWSHMRSGTPTEETHIPSEIILIKYMASNELIDAEFKEDKNANFHKVTARIIDIKPKGLELLAPFLAFAEKSISDMLDSELDDELKNPHRENLWYRMVRKELDKRIARGKKSLKREKTDREKKEDRRHTQTLIVAIVIGIATVCIATWSAFLTYQDQQLKDQVFQLSERVRTLEKNIPTEKQIETIASPQSTAAQQGARPPNSVAQSQKSVTPAPPPLSETATPEKNPK